MTLREFLSDIEARRTQVGLIAVALAVVTLWILSKTLPDYGAIVLLDLNRHPAEGDSSRFPFSVQTGMWIAFYFALGELLIREMSARKEHRQLKAGHLPEDFETILQAGDLPDLYRKLRNEPDRNKAFLPRLIDRCLLQFQASQSIDQSASLLNTSVEMFLHEVDLRYNLLRYMCWLIPSLGFIGTVVGIGEALEWAGKNPDADDLLGVTTAKLAVSFHGTFVALVMASILVFLQNIIQSREEHALNLGAQYCLDNLINRLYVRK